jgi:hypothetical protein
LDFQGYFCKGKEVVLKALEGSLCVKKGCSQIVEYKPLGPKLQDREIRDYLPAPAKKQIISNPTTTVTGNAEFYILSCRA